MMASVFSTIQSWDNTVLFAIQDHLRNTVLDGFMLALTNIGEGGIVWLAICLPMLFFRRHRRTAVMALTALLLATLVESVVKDVVRRPRPFIAFPNVPLILKPPASFSFPSGHALSSFATAGVLAHRLRRLSAVFWVLAAFIAISRPYLFMHYPSDTIAGMLMGLACCAITLYAYRHRPLAGIADRLGP